MGRPIKKKFFGNTNTGVVTPGGDNNIGGEGIASVTITNAGDYTGTLPTVSFGTPEIPTGIQATGTVNGKLLGTTVVAAGGSDYTIGDVLTLSGGAKSATASVTVASLVTRNNNGITLINGGTANDVGDEYWLEEGWTTPLKVRVTASSGGNATAINVVQNGVWSGPDAAPTGNQSGDFHMGPGSIDDNGSGLVFSISYSAYAVNTVTVNQEGTYTSVPTNPVTTTVTPVGGSGATLTAHWGVKSITMTENGSGYISVADAAPTFSSGAAAGTSVLEATQQNAIVGVNLATGDIVDIVKQESSDSYWVNTGSDTILLDLAPSNASYGLYIEATDSDGDTYWVRKLESRTVTLGNEGGTGVQWKDYGRAQWTFNSPVAGVSVTIRNAA